jgi:hypothetical protein
MQNIYLALASTMSLAITGCAASTATADQADQTGDVAGQVEGQAIAAVTCPVPTIDPTRSLAVTDPTALAKFSFQRVLTQIASSANATNTPLAIYQAWMATFADCNNPKIDPNGYGIVCPRVESQFGTFNPFSQSGPHFVPIALTNRFDLAPTSGADCGENRIEFALQGGQGRGFIIFESRMPNPNPAAGLAGCAPVADFWAQLSTDPSATSRAGKLEQLYFTGIPGFEPVVAASHYGLEVNSTTTTAHTKGQIRTNFFADSVQWQLREFQLSKPCAATAACALSVDDVTVKVNPANELFTGTHPNAPAFQAQFLGQIPALSQSTAATIGMSTGNNFNEFESVSSGKTDVLYATFTEQSFQNQITAALTSAGSTLTAQNILDRATTQTCAGCHQLSSGAHAQLGAGVVWPRSLGFVQIDEQSNLSQALTTSFLPHRSTVLTTFLQGQCIGVSPVDNGANIGGGGLDAAN